MNFTVSNSNNKKQLAVLIQLDTSVITLVIILVITSGTTSGTTSVITSVIASVIALEFSNPQMSDYAIKYWF